VAVIDAGTPSAMSTRSTRMTRMTVTRTLAAALAAATLTAPSAHARVDPPISLTAASVAHHLRSAGSPDAARLPHGTQRDPRDLRVGPAAPEQAPLPGPPTWATQTKPITAPLAPATPHDGGIDLATIGLGIAGSVVAVGAIASIAARSRRPQRRRVTA
jgi:hypothetical protein